MWRRSWLSREVLLFGLFFGSLAMTAALAWIDVARWVPALAVVPLAWLAAVLGVAGTVASAFIYLVPARPAWNMAHTPLDFLLSMAMLGAATFPLIVRAANLVAATVSGHVPGAWKTLLPHTHAHMPTWIFSLTAALWLANQGIRYVRLAGSARHERRASASLLLSERLRYAFAASFVLVIAASLCAVTGDPAPAACAACAAVLAARYLFFVSVVPLNMALTFVREVHA
jgi:DMSO reductase anchor subunit